MERLQRKDREKKTLGGWGPSQPIRGRFLGRRSIWGWEKGSSAMHSISIASQRGGRIKKRIEEEALAVIAVGKGAKADAIRSWFGT